MSLIRRLFLLIRAWLRRHRLLVTFAIVEIKPLGGSVSFASDVNDRTVVVGVAQLANGHSHAYAWDAGAMFDLGAFPGAAESSAFAVNNHGIVVGQSQLPPAGVHTHGFVAPNGLTIAPAHDIGTLGGDNSVVLDFSIDHIAVGWADVASGSLHAFVRWSGSGLTDLTPALAGNSSAEAVDDAGGVVGWMTRPGGTTAFRWSSPAGLTPLLPPGASSSRAFGCTNRAGLVVGEAALAGGTTHAVVWDAANTVTDLGTLGGPTSVAFDVLGGSSWARQISLAVAATRF